MKSPVIQGRHRLLVALLFLVVPVATPVDVRSQDVDSLEASLPGLSGLERARTLVDLTELLRSAAPPRAALYGAEALTILEVLPEPATTVRALNELSWAHMELGAYDRATQHADSAQALAEEVGELPGLARALNNLGVIHRRLGDFPEALEHFGRSLAIQRRLGDRSAVATSLNNLSVVYGFDLGEYDVALERQMESLAVNEELGDSVGVARSHNNLGVIHQNLGDSETALEHLGLALDEWRRMERRPRIAATLSNLADVHSNPSSEQFDLDRALQYEQEALAIRTDIGSNPAIAESLAGIGRIHTLAGEFVPAEENLERALELRERAGERRSLATTYVALASLERMKGNYFVAEANARRAVAVADSIQATAVLRDAHTELSYVLEARGDAVGALREYRNARDLDAELFTAAASRRVAMLRNERELQAAEQALVDLQAETRVEQAEDDRREAMIAAGALLLLVTFLLYRRQVQASMLRQERAMRQKLEQLVGERTAALEDSNRQLSQQSLTDQLTGLRNRRYLKQTLEDHLGATVRVHQNAARDGRPVNPGSDILFYLIDLDHFKSVNDEYGHAMGDLVLAETAGLLKGMCRASDIVLRWGGEEFLVVSHNSDRKNADMFAERIRRTMAEHVFEGGGRRLQRTCSIGFAAFPFVSEEAESLSWEQTVHLADLALYEAKNGGRNRWVGVTSTPESTVALLGSEAETLDGMREVGQIAVSASPLKQSQAS